LFGALTFAITGSKKWWDKGAALIAVRFHGVFMQSLALAIVKNLLIFNPPEGKSHIAGGFNHRTAPSFTKS
jgi:hypothetical protein